LRTTEPHLETMKQKKDGNESKDKKGEK